MAARFRFKFIEGKSLSPSESNLEMYFFLLGLVLSKFRGNRVEGLSKD